MPPLVLAIAAVALISALARLREWTLRRVMDSDDLRRMEIELRRQQLVDAQTRASYDRYTQLMMQMRATGDRQTAREFLGRKRSTAQAPVVELEPIALGELKVGMEFAPIERALEFVK